MAKPISKGSAAPAKFPIIFERFHIIQLVNQAVECRSQGLSHEHLTQAAKVRAQAYGNADHLIAICLRIPSKLKYLPENPPQTASPKTIKS